MAVKTWRMEETYASGSNFLSLAEPEAFNNLGDFFTTSWKIGTKGSTTVPQISYMRSFVRSDTTTFSSSSPLIPKDPPSNTLGDCFRTKGFYKGTFEAGTWECHINVQGLEGGSGLGVGRMRIRLFKSSSSTGANATLVKDTVVTDSSNVPISPVDSISVTFTVNSFEMNNDFLFLQCAWEIMTASTSTLNDVHMVQTNDGSMMLVGTNFYPAKDVVFNGMETGIEDPPGVDLRLTPGNIITTLDNTNTILPPTAIGDNTSAVNPGEIIVSYSGEDFSTNMPVNNVVSFSTAATMWSLGEYLI